MRGSGGEVQGVRQTLQPFAHSFSRWCLDMSQVPATLLDLKNHLRVPPTSRTGRHLFGVYGLGPIMST